MNQSTAHEDDISEYDQGPPFVFGFTFIGGVGTEINWEDASTVASSADWVWLHLNMHNEATRDWINAQGDLPYAAKNALLAGETRPRVTSLGKGLVVNLRGVNLNDGADPEDMVSIRIWLDERRVITTRRRRLKAAVDIREQIIDGHKIKTPGALVAQIAGRLTTRMAPFVDQIDDDVDELEEAILNGEGQSIRSRLAETRHDAVMLRRFIAPQREALTRLVQDESTLFDTETRVDLRETADQVTRLTEEIDAARERAMVLQDQLTDARAEEMNRNMMVLSVVAAVFLPLGFLTGLFGINVGGMPGVNNGLAFWLVVLACIAIGGVLMAIFRALKWL